MALCRRSGSTRKSHAQAQTHVYRGDQTVLSDNLIVQYRHTYACLPGTMFAFSQCRDSKYLGRCWANSIADRAFIDRQTSLGTALQVLS